MKNKRFLNRIRNDKGESIIEAIVGVMITSIALAALAATIMFGQKQMRGSDEKMNALYAEFSALSTYVSTGKADENGYTTGDLSISVTFNPGKAGESVYTDTGSEYCLTNSGTEMMAFKK